MWSEWHKNSYFTYSKYSTKMLAKLILIICGLIGMWFYHGYMDKVHWAYCIRSHRVAKHLKPVLHDAVVAVVNCYAYYYIWVIYYVFIAGACSHVRSYHYYAHSIWSRDDYIAYRCPSWADFQENRCDNFSKNLMGEFSDREKFVIYLYTFSSSLFKYY